MQMISNCWSLNLNLFSEPSIGSRGKTLRTSGNFLNLENDRIIYNSSFYSLTGPNALARTSLLERQEKLQYNCEEMPLNGIRREMVDPEEFHNILVDEKHKLLYCYVPKVTKFLVDCILSEICFRIISNQSEKRSESFKNQSGSIRLILT